MMPTITQLDTGRSGVMRRTSDRSDAPDPSLAIDELDSPAPTETRSHSDTSAGHVPAWEEVARTYGRTIYNFAYRLSGDPDDANDLTQEVLLRVRRGLKTYQPITFEGWLWRITRNAFLDEVRRRNRRPTAPLPEGFEGFTGVSSPPPDQMLAFYRLSDDVQAALLELPIEFRESVVLCDVVGLSYVEVAEAVDVPVGTVRSRIHRGRKMLRSMLPDAA